jgi:hypothetical protein
MTWGLALLACVSKDEPGDTGTGTQTADSGDTQEELPIDADEDGFSAEEDCDDEDATVYPGAPELCGDGRRTDCERISEDGLVTLDGTQGFDDLQAALDAASEGSELLLCAGVHAGPFVASQPVTLRASGEVVLSGANAGSTLTVPGGSALYGLSLRDGDGDMGGALRVTSAGTLHLEDCRLSGSRARLGGGLALAPATAATLVRTTIEDNEAMENGGGVYVPEDASLDLSDSSAVQGNRASGAGGGVCLVDASLVGGVVSGNTVQDDPISPTPAGSGGGGVWTQGVCTITAAEISGNAAPQGAGVMTMGAELSLVDVSVHDNTTGPDGAGGGLSASDALVQLLGTTEIFSNQAGYGGGASIGTTTWVGGRVYDNEVEGDGGGLYLGESTVSEVVIESNSAVSGGGLFVSSASTLLGVTVSANEAKNSGGGVALSPEPELGGPTRIEDSSVAGNVSELGGGLYVGQAVEVLRTAVTGNEAFMGGGVYVSDSEVQLEALSVLRNTADLGGGAWVGGALVAAQVDFGMDADDNAVSDIEAGGSYTDFGADTSLECNRDGCMLLP